MRLINTPRFRRDYGKLPEAVLDQIDKALKLLEENPHHPSLRTHKRRGEHVVWQARATRSYRILFKMDGENIILLNVIPHAK